MSGVLCIFTGTDPESKRGGIGFALPGYLHAAKNAGFDVLTIPTYHPIARYGSWWWLMKALPIIAWKIFKAKKRYKQVLIYSHAGAGLSLLREHVVMVMSRLLGIQCIIQLHAMQIDRYLAAMIPRFVFRILISPANTLAVLTPWWKLRLESSGIKKVIYVIPNPLPENWERIARKRAVIAQHNFQQINLLSMTRIERGKGVDLVLRALNLLPEFVNLTVAGDGAQMNELKEYVRRNDLESRVTFTGWVSGDLKQHLIDRASIFCLPSEYDSFGMGYIEAMANGLPVVALNWGPVSDVVRHNQTGILLSSKDPQQIASAVKELLDAGLRKYMGRKAQNWVISEFSSFRVAGLLKEAVTNMMGNK